MTPLGLSARENRVRTEYKSRRATCTSEPHAQFVLLYPPQGEKGPNRVATVLSKQTLPRQALAKTLGLDQLHITQHG
jgi:hypothetical protein